MLIDSEIVDTTENLGTVTEWMIEAVEDVDEAVRMLWCQMDVAPIPI
jgi:hypothetical protein